ncbi:hypothetical protein HanIR_Chr01g0031321 [Helianthus annuus]|nr:hypothetical protein HanIR_Chr01g0031321 [Helianthus annuus]
MFGEHTKKDKRVVQPSTFKLTNISIAGRVQLASTTATHVYLNPTTGPMKSIATRFTYILLNPLRSIQGQGSVLLYNTGTSLPPAYTLFHNHVLYLLLLWRRGHNLS